MEHASGQHSRPAVELDGSVVRGGFPPTAAVHTTHVDKLHSSRSESKSQPNSAVNCPSWRSALLLLLLCVQQSRGLRDNLSTIYTYERELEYETRGEGRKGRLIEVLHTRYLLCGSRDGTTAARLKEAKAKQQTAEQPDICSTARESSN